MLLSGLSRLVGLDILPQVVISMIVLLSQVMMLRTCPNITLTVERDVKRQLCITKNEKNRKKRNNLHLFVFNQG